MNTQLRCEIMLIEYSALRTHECRGKIHTNILLPPNSLAIAVVASHAGLADTNAVPVPA